MTGPALHLDLPNPQATAALGRALGAVLEPGVAVALNGDLGAGKTALAKDAIAAQGAVEADDVVSPTFVVAIEYPGRVPVLHIDAYRLTSGRDLEALGYELDRPGALATLIEWADRVEAGLPADRLEVTLEHADGARTATITATGARSGALLERLRAELAPD